MRKSTDVKKTGGVGNEAVLNATGKTWEEWLDLLDTKGAAEMNHKQIVALLAENSDMSGWWQQTVAVGYEQARGLRQKHEKEGAYEIGRSKTVSADVSRAFEAFVDEERRMAWLPDHVLETRTSQSNKSVRFTWSDGQSWIEARFYPKGEGKCQISVQHGKLPDSETAEEMKAFWAERLDRFKAFLEGSAKNE